MGLVEDQVGKLEELRGELRRRDALRALGEDAHWPAERSLVLARDLAVELGNPAIGSVSALLWTSVARVEDQIELLGPDIGELSGSQPLAQLILVGLSPKPDLEDDDQYELLLALYQALDDFALRGLTTRATAGHRDVWYRLSREAQVQGFSLFHLGAELHRRLKALDRVAAAQILFVTEKASVSLFEDIARQSQRISAALIKRHEEVEHECDLCELSDVCVEGLLR